MSPSNRTAYTLVGLAVAMIALQGAAAYGIVVGGRALSRSEPVAAALRTAGVVASSVASTVAKNGVARAARLAGRGASEPGTSVALLPAPDVASFASDDATAECYLVGPSGQVRRIDVKAIADGLAAGTCETHCVIMKQVAHEVAREVSREVSREVARKVSCEVSSRAAWSAAPAKPII